MIHSNGKGGFFGQSSTVRTFLIYALMSGVSINMETGRRQSGVLKKRVLILFLLLIVPFLISACNSSVNLKKVHSGEVVELGEPGEAEKAEVRTNLMKELQQGLSTYRLSPGDALEVMYHIALTSEAQGYRVRVNDELSVEFYSHPQLNRTVLVRPDGKITLPLKGEFDAAGLQPVELAAGVAAGFADVLNKPQVTVSVSKYSSRLMELQRAITNAPRGQAKVCTIGPDGKVYLPLLSGIRAANRSVDELRQAINQEYAKEFHNLEVSVLIESITGNRVFVFGEVQRPGVIAMPKPMTVLQVVASAGGVLPTGSREHTKILYWNEKNEPVVRTVNIVDLMERLSLEQELIVPNNSVIFIPKTTIARMDQFVDQYIRQLFLFQGANIGFYYELHREAEPIR
jgi:protein involved in polysaccharide export with SLBB domain